MLLFPLDPGACEAHPVSFVCEQPFESSPPQAAGEWAVHVGIALEVCNKRRACMLYSLLLFNLSIPGTISSFNVMS